MALEAQQRHLAASVKNAEAELERQHALRKKVEVDAKRVHALDAPKAREGDGGPLNTLQTNE